MNSIDSILQSLPTREDLISALPSRDDLIGAVGLQRRSSTPEMIPALTLFGTGMVIGAGLALLFAPRTGTDMRRSLSESMQQYTGYGEGDDETDQESRGYGSGRQASPQHSQQDRYGSSRQMSGQTSEPSRQMSQSSYQSGQGTSGSGQMQGHTEQQRIEEREHSRSKTPGSRDI